MGEDLIYIYKITNKLNRFIYIGQTKNIKERWIQHCKSSNKTYIGKIIQEYKKENFEIEEIDRCFEKHKYIIEEYYIRKYIKENNNNVYNKNYGSKPNEDLRAKIMENRHKKEREDIYKNSEFIEKMKETTRGERNGMYNKKGENAVNGQHVYMLDEGKNVVKEFVSVRHALDYLGLKGHCELIKACKKGIKYKNYYWIKTWKN